MSDKRKEILDTIKSKTVLKKKVFEQTKEIFSELKSIVFQISEELQSDLKGVQPHLHIQATDSGMYEVRLRIAGDTIIFMMHSNVFDFDKSHRIHKTSYVRDNHGSSYCGVIMVYNFLSDSFKYNRVNDLGYLVGRIFVNNQKHFFVEGKKEMGFLFNDFQQSILDKEQLKKIIEAIIAYCLGFDLYTPPYHQVSEVSVLEMKEVSMNMTIKTGKRLGFKFSSEDDIS